MIKYIMPLIVGAVIGYITNDIAIKMLFHPRKAYFIGKWQIPFTPGLIPKEKARVAKSIGRMVGSQLLNEEVIRNTLLSENTLFNLRNAMEQFIDKNRNNPETLNEFLSHFSTHEVTERVIRDVKSDLTELVYRKLTDFHFGESISKTAIQKLKEKLNSSMFSIVTSLIDDSTLDGIAAHIGEYIDNIISDNSEEIIREVMDKETDKFRYMRVCDIISKYDTKIPGLIDFVVSSYKKLIENNISKVLQSIDLAKIVEERIDAFDVMQLEKMIFDVMNKELKSIIYLGAVLGLLMGFINIFIDMLV